MPECQSNYQDRMGRGRMSYVILTMAFIVITVVLLHLQKKRIYKDLNVLTGKDAEKFLEAMNNPRPLSQEQRDRIEKARKMFKVKNDEHI